MKYKTKCPDCIGFCNFGKFPDCKPSVVKEKKLRESVKETKQ